MSLEDGSLFDAASLAGDRGNEPSLPAWLSAVVGAASRRTVSSTRCYRHQFQGRLPVQRRFVSWRQRQRAVTSCLAKCCGWCRVEEDRVLHALSLCVGGYRHESRGRLPVRRRFVSWRQRQRAVTSCLAKCCGWCRVEEDRVLHALLSPSVSRTAPCSTPLR